MTSRLLYAKASWRLASLVRVSLLLLWLVKLAFDESFRLSYFDHEIFTWPSYLQFFAPHMPWLTRAPTILALRTATLVLLFVALCLPFLSQYSPRLRSYLGDRRTLYLDAATLGLAALRMGQRL